MKKHTEARLSADTPIPSQEERPVQIYENGVATVFISYPDSDYAAFREGRGRFPGLDDLEEMVARYEAAGRDDPAAE